MGLNEMLGRTKDSQGLVFVLNGFFGTSFGQKNAIGDVFKHYYTIHRYRIEFLDT